MIDDEYWKLQKFLIKVRKLQEEAKTIEHLHFSINWYYADITFIPNTEDKE